jgi:hypothetical protein
MSSSLILIIALSVLHNGLLSSRRTGRSVLYWQTPLAQSMISTQRTSATLPPGGAIGATD